MFLRHISQKDLTARFGVAVESEVEKLDKAFEWLVLFLTVAFTAFFQWMASVWQKKISETVYLTPLAFAMRVFFVPISIIIFSWFGKIVIQEQNKKMLFRKFSWCWGMSQLWGYIFLTSILITLDMSISYTATAMLVGFLMLPLIYFIYRKIMNLYKTESSEVPFWTSKWWDYGTTLIAMVSIICFWIFIFSTLQLMTQTP
jgi:hypothetical protein